MGILWAQQVSFERFVSAPSGWQMMGTESVYVWYLPGYEGLARQVHIWAADAFKEMTHLLDFQPEGALVVRLHPSAYYWGQQPPKEPTGNLTPPYPIVEVFPAATRAKTAGLVRSYVIAAFLEHLYFPEGNRLQNRSLLYLPDWYLWGFAFFWGEGWRNEDLSHLHSMPDDALLQMVRRSAMPSPFYRSLYKSIWFYIYRTYGQRKLMDFLYMTRLTRNISESISLILNSDETELMAKWRTFLREAVSEANSQEIEPLEEAVIAAAVAPVSQRYAYARLSPNNVVQYFLYLEGKVYPLPGGWRWRDTYVEPELPMAFSASGTLAWTGYEKTGLKLWLWSPDSRTYQKLPLDLVSVQDISWENERELWVSGMSAEGRVAIYSFALPQGRLRKVAEAQGDLLYPRQWQGQLWAIWQPDTSHLKPLDVSWAPFRTVVQRGDEWYLLPFPPFNSAIGGWITSSHALATLSDIHGTGTAWIFETDTSYPSALQVSGLYKWVGQDSEKAYALAFRSGKTSLISVPLSQLWQEGKVFPPIVAAEALQLSLQRRAARMAFYATPSTPPPPPDTIPAETSVTQRSPFYLFDEEGVYRPSRRKKTARSAPPPTVMLFPSPKPIGKVPTQSLIRDIRMRGIIHPLMRLGWHIHLLLRDPHENNEGWLRWAPYADLRSSELSLGYLRRRGSLQFFWEGTRQSHFFPRRRYGYTFRNLTHFARIGARFPILPALQVEGWCGLLQSQRFHMERIIDWDFSARAWRWGIGATLTYHTLAHREEMPWQGWHVRVRAETYDKGRYALLGMQAERFQPLAGIGVLHTTLQAIGGGNNPRTLLLGGIPHWVSYEFLNRERIALLSPPEAYYLAEYVFIPGFPYNARSGRYLMSFSGVLRMPVAAWIRSFSLPARAIYGFEWQIGYHIATTWTTGNPFSQKNPIDAQYIYRPPLVISVQTLKSPFLMSAGTGMTFRIMRLPIGLEAYWPIEEGTLRQPRLLVSFKHGI
ncbi:MAG: hypothetical protein NZ580_05010 [Bacteroidia bacterium]|nr:hypothetical protein [Bacteroidia bacterium]MDW8235820.1 hypothetical protein [Bacteroidia bacterium]